jgi:hypothetical protein
MFENLSQLCSCDLLAAFVLQADQFVDVVLFDLNCKILSRALNAKPVTTCKFPSHFVIADCFWCFNDLIRVTNGAVSRFRIIASIVLWLLLES